MAMTFSSTGCRQAADELNSSANNLDSILNSDLTNIIGQVKNIYDSPAANELYAAFDKLKQKFPMFIESINDCSKYLADTVAPAYEKVEQQAASKIG